MKQLFIFILLLSLISCALVNNIYRKNGAIYGRISTHSINKAVLQDLTISVKIEETLCEIRPDSLGVFYFDEIPPGIYSISYYWGNDEHLKITNLIVKQGLVAILPFAGDITKKHRRPREMSKRQEYSLYNYPVCFGELEVKIPLKKSDKSGFVSIGSKYNIAENVSDSLGIVKIQDIPIGNYDIQVVRHRRAVEIEVNWYEKVEIISGYILRIEPPRMHDNRFHDLTFFNWKPISKYILKEKKE